MTVEPVKGGCRGGDPFRRLDDNGADPLEQSLGGPTLGGSAKSFRKGE